jgi:hypothetical protein
LNPAGTFADSAISLDSFRGCKLSLSSANSHAQNSAQYDQDDFPKIVSLRRFMARVMKVRKAFRYCCFRSR